MIEDNTLHTRRKLGRKFPSPHLVLTLLGLALLLATGCAKMIGDECDTALDCEPGQICDRALPGGYCTVAPCEPDTCPSEAVCVDYPPFLSYCMLSCDGDGDCRSDYACVTNIQGIEYCGVEDEQPQP